MALTAYCKKCNREVEPGEICPRCGTKLAKTATHAAWVMERRPVADWMCWNAVLRWVLPAAVAVLLLVLLLEGLSGGLAAIERLFQSGFPATLGILLFALLAGVFGMLCLQGPELMDYVIDSRGVHVTRYLPSPTPLKLIARGKSPAKMKEVNPEAETPMLRLEERDLPWRAVARVQLWPEKCYILFYAPKWWLRIPVRATPFSWEDALYFVRDKLGKKKAIDLPEHLRVQPEKKAASPRRRRAEPAYAPQSSFAPEPSLPAEPEDSPAPSVDPARPSLLEEDGAAEAADPWTEEVPETVGEQMTLDLASAEE